MPFLTSFLLFLATLWMKASLSNTRLLREQVALPQKKCSRSPGYVSGIRMVAATG